MKSTMQRSILAAAVLSIGLAAAPAGAQAPAQLPARPLIETRKVEGTDGGYIFRHGNHQSIFIVTPAGVVATDPVGYGRPQGGDAYLAEIRKVTNQPIRYLIYSHHHFDHIAGGWPLKQAGATILAHRRAKERLEVLKDPFTPLPDEVMDTQRTLTIGGTAIELTDVGLNHSDSTLVLRLPKEDLIFVVDLLPVGTVPGRGMIDYHPLEAEESVKKILAMKWSRMIPGHPGPGDRLGTRKDVEEQLEFQRDASEAVKTAAREGKCWDQAEKEVKLPKYEKWPGYAAGLPFVVRRYCGLWGRGT